MTWEERFQSPVAPSSQTISFVNLTSVWTCLQEVTVMLILPMIVIIYVSQWLSIIQKHQQLKHVAIKLSCKLQGHSKFIYRSCLLFVKSHLLQVGNLDTIKWAICSQLTDKSNQNILLCYFCNWCLVGIWHNFYNNRHFQRHDVAGRPWFIARVLKLLPRRAR